MNSKPLPELKSDEEAEEFVEKARLTDYDLSSLTPMRFELKRKDKSA
ncbi:MAG TPA: CopG family antitoxin, partial [Methylocystis sp.]|nr:CopG family antitoxin [Methylocystis sp.]